MDLEPTSRDEEMLAMIRHWSSAERLQAARVLRRWAFLLELQWIDDVLPRQQRASRLRRPPERQNGGLLS